MPQNTHINVGTNWTALTNADVTAMTFQNVSGYPIFVTASNGADQPQAGGGLMYASGQGEGGRAIADIFPGVSGANRLWARSSIGTQEVFVSHA